MRNLAIVALILALSGCGDRARLAPVTSDSTSLTTSDESPKGSPVPCLESTGGQDGVHMLLTDVRAAAHSGFDRVVFEFKPGHTPGGIPKYRLAEASPPFTKDPSDQPMTVEGDAFYSLNLQGASGVDTSGTEYQQTYTGPKEIKADLAVLVEAEEQGDFEATINWIFGANQPSCPKVSTLTGPLRIVIDFPTGE